MAMPSKLRVGLAGGIATPAAAAAAFAMGAAYIMTGSVNQACVESGTSDEVRAMLAETRQSDVAMAPAADMFEMGVTVQVLKRGTMFPMRAAKLYELYRSCAGIDDIPAIERDKLEKTFFQAPLDDIWQQTRSYFLKRDPRQVERAERDPKHRMALVFRWYLGQAAHWAKDGEASRRIDYQVWCGPAMGAFNEWTAGSFLAAPEQPHGGDRGTQHPVRRGAAFPRQPSPLPGHRAPGRCHAYPTAGRQTDQGVPFVKQEELNRTIPTGGVPLAIIGIGCLFPQAGDSPSYWANIREGIDAITDIPATHWGWPIISTRTRNPPT